MSNEGVPVCGNQDEERRLSSCENMDPNRKESLGGWVPGAGRWLNFCAHVMSTDLNVTML